MPLTLEEIAVAIFPSPRVSADGFIRVLQDNGITVEMVGRGTGIVGIAGLSQRIGVTVIGFAAHDVPRVYQYARICGVQVAQVEEDSSMEV